MRMAVVKKSHAKVNTKSTMLIMIFCTCKKFKYRFDSLHVKQNLISEIKHLLYELSEDLHQDIRLENRKYFENPNNEWRHLAPITPTRDKMLAIVAKWNNRYHIFSFLSHFAWLLYPNILFSWKDWIQGTPQGSAIRT